MTEKTVKEKTIIIKSLDEKLAEIQLNLKAPKSQFNKFANFYYRNCEDILEAVKPLLNGLTLTIHDEIVQVGERYYVKATAKLVDPNATGRVESTAFAREALTKTGMDEAQITGAASSYARKYALNGLFLIDDTADPDTKDNTPAKPMQKPVATKPNAQIPAKTYAKPPVTTQASTPKNAPAPVVTPVQGKPTDPASIFNGSVPTIDEIRQEVNDKDAFRDKDTGEINRDTKGHTACIDCGAMVSQRVEEYSLKSYNKVLCMKCQLKLKGQSGEQPAK